MDICLWRYDMEIYYRDMIWEYIIERRYVNILSKEQSKEWSYERNLDKLSKSKYKPLRPEGPRGPAQRTPSGFSIAMPKFPATFVHSSKLVTLNTRNMAK